MQAATISPWPSESAETDSDPSRIPNSVAELLQWLQEKDERQKQLEDVERRFLASGNINLLSEWMSKVDYPGVILKEPITEQFAILGHDRFLAESKDPEELAWRQELLRHISEDARAFNPNVEIREVEAVDGTMHRVFVGVDPKALQAFCELRIEERRTERDLTRGKEHLAAMITKSETAQNPDDVQASNRTSLPCNQHRNFAPQLPG